MVQVQRNMNFINSFSDGPGHKDNAKKINIFSSNVPSNIRNEIGEINGYLVAAGIGKHLGSLLHHGKIKKDGFKGIVDKNEQASWM